MNRSAKLLMNLDRMFRLKLFFGRSLKHVPEGSLIFFPCHSATCFCGLAGIVSLKSGAGARVDIDPAGLQDRFNRIEARQFERCTQQNLTVRNHYLNGRKALDEFLNKVKDLKLSNAFVELVMNSKLRSEIAMLSSRLQALIKKEEQILSERIGHLETEVAEVMSASLETLKDAHWCLTAEIQDNTGKTEALITHPPGAQNPVSVKIFKEINAVLNSIDRLEVRGRDSAGISLLFILERSVFPSFMESVKQEDLSTALNERISGKILSNNDISLFPKAYAQAKGPISIAFTYKIAAEIGSLGDNITFIRKQIKMDPILQRLVTFPCIHHTISSHTRWASVGEITEANCHPVDNALEDEGAPLNGTIHACLNGDIDNYLELKEELENENLCIPDGISTDTKMIPLQIERYVREGFDIQEAFRRAVNTFKGSHAISMHTDLAPGKLFLAQKGSGQAIFIGLSEDVYMPASEVYGFIEETSAYLKLDGEKIVEGIEGQTQGQIFILDQASKGGVQGITAMYYDGTPIQLGNNDIKHTDITSRDIDRQNFPHYFLKEISESPLSVEKTLHNRWKSIDEKSDRLTTTLDESILPGSLAKAIAEKSIRRIFFIGQGTAGIAARVCADILNYYLDDPLLYIDALKASELSGFELREGDSPSSMADTLIIAISQSGTTTDTNRTVDMVRERGASTLAIVNRRDSDLTFKVDGVMYTSTGRDLEMSVASTKAFYSQIVAGALLGLQIAHLSGKRGTEFVSREIMNLLEIPSHMKTILDMK